MGKHRAPKNKRIRKAFKKVAMTAAMAAGSTAVAVSALFSAQGIAVATPDNINVFGQDLSCTTAVDDQTDWNTIAERQEAALQEEFYREAYDNFLAQFDQFRGQPLEQMAKNVNALVYNSIERIHKPTYGFNAPVETVVSGNGDSQDVAALQEDIMRYLGVSQDKLLVMRVYDQGDQRNSTTMLLVNTTDPILMSNFPTISHVSSISKDWLLTRGATANPTPLDARNSLGQVCKPPRIS